MRLPVVLLVAAFAIVPARTATAGDGEECARRAEDGIVEICRRAVAARPDDPAILRHYARALIAIGSFDEAARVQGRVLELLPDDWAANYHLAGTLGFIRRYSEALEPMLRAVKLRPEHVPGHQAAAVVYAMLGLHEEALGETRRAAELGSAVAMFDLVRLYEQGIGTTADPAEAFRWLDRAAEGGHVYAMRLLVEVYLEGRYGQAPDDAKAELWAARHRAALPWR